LQAADACINHRFIFSIKIMVDFLKKIFGTKNERELKRLFKVVDEINSLEPAVSALSSEQLSAKTGEFRNL
jgi:preprotein translocase subunit SecA